MTVAQRQSTVKHGKAWGPRTAEREDGFKKEQLGLEVMAQWLRALGYSGIGLRFGSQHSPGGNASLWRSDALPPLAPKGTTCM